jgi:hypothetical protein
MAILISIITILVSFVNYALCASDTTPFSTHIPNLILEAVFVFVSCLAVLGYRGKRTLWDYERRGYRIFTIGFAVTILALFANIAVLAIIALHQSGVIAVF